jgi:hypothetical protein
MAAWMFLLVARLRDFWQPGNHVDASACRTDGDSASRLPQVMLPAVLRVCMGRRLCSIAMRYPDAALLAVPLF